MVFLKGVEFYAFKSLYMQKKGGEPDAEKQKK